MNEPKCCSTVVKNIALGKEFYVCKGCGNEVTEKLALWGDYTPEGYTYSPGDEFTITKAIADAAITEIKNMIVDPNSDLVAEIDRFVTDGGLDRLDSDDDQMDIFDWSSD